MWTEPAGRCASPKISTKITEWKNTVSKYTELIYYHNELIPDITGLIVRVKWISEFFLKEINVLHDVGAAASKTMYEHSSLNTTHVTTDSNRQ